MKKFYGKISTLVEDLDIVVEGVSELRKMFVDTHKIPENTFDEILAIDPSPTKKYSLWMIKRWQAERSVGIMGHLKELVVKFNDLVESKRIRGEDSDIGKYKSTEALYDRVKQFEGEDLSKTQMKKGVKDVEDIAKEDLVYENEYVYVVYPKNRERSMQYGTKSHWCTAAQGERNYFSQYYKQQGCNLYYIIKKKPIGDYFIKREDTNETSGTYGDNKYDKVAVAAHANGKKEYFDIYDNFLPNGRSRPFTQQEFEEFAESVKLPKE